jgi:hypothetical protein
LSACDAVLERLVQGFQDMTAELGQFIQEEHTIMGQRYVARQGDVSAAEQPHIRDGVMGRTTRAGRDPRRAGAG